MFAARAAHLKFDEISDGTCFFGFPAGLTLWTPDSTKFIGIAFAEIGTYLKENKQQRNDKNTYKTKDEKRQECWHVAFLNICVNLATVLAVSPSPDERLFP